MDADGWLWRLEAVVPAHALDSFDAALRVHSSYVWASTDAAAASWRLAALLETDSGAEAARNALLSDAERTGVGPTSLRIERVPPTDWADRSLIPLPPVRLGRYVIRGSSAEGAWRSGTVSLLLEAGRAFGSGRHESTAGCLLAFDRLARRRRYRRALDLGTGSGILALAIAKTWSIPVLASDVDGDAVAVARDNARRNGLRGRVQVVRSDGVAHRRVRTGAPFDLIVANILAAPLCRMAGDVRRCLQPGGTVVLSGFLERDGVGVVAAYGRHGVTLVERIGLGGWQTLVMTRPGPPYGIGRVSSPPGA